MCILKLSRLHSLKDVDLEWLYEKKLCWNSHEKCVFGQHTLVMVVIAIELLVKRTSHTDHISKFTIY
jgi:hypothetical protein